MSLVRIVFSYFNPVTGAIEYTFSNPLTGVDVSGETIAKKFAELIIRVDDSLRSVAVSIYNSSPAGVDIDSSVLPQLREIAKAYMPVDWIYREMTRILTPQNE